MRDVRRLEQLRRRAHEALARGEVVLARLPALDGIKDLQRLIEDLSLHQAELQVQNEELIEAQSATARALAQYTLLFRSLPLAALVVDDRGWVRQVNRAASELFGFGRRRVAVRQSLFRLFRNNHQTQLMQALRERGATHSVLSGLSVQRGDGSITLDAYLIHLSTEYHLDEHTLMLFVDRTADVERQHHADRTTALLDLRRAAEELDERELLTRGLHWAEQLTGSSLAFCHSIAPESGAWPVLVAGTAGFFPDAEVNTPATESGPWLEAARLGTVVQLEAPEMREATEHNTQLAGVSRLLCVPIMAGSVVRMVLSVGQRPAPYPAHALQALVAIGSELWNLIEQVRREQELRKLSHALDQSVEGVMITELDGRITYVNPSFTRITGYDSEEAVGQTPRILGSGMQDEIFYRELWQLLMSHGSWHGELMTRRKDGTLYPQRLKISTVLGPHGEPRHCVGTLVDISERKSAEEQIYKLAYFDPLTGLPNRRLLTDRIQQALADFQRSGVGAALLFLDLDDFKRINDTLGHDQGDHLLQQVATRIVGCLREVDSVARIGGDEFVVLLRRIIVDPDRSGTDVERVAQKILSVVSEPVRLRGQIVHVTPSIGIALLDDLSQSTEDLLKHADLAMYQAKAVGRGVARFFDPTMQAAVEARAQMESDLRDALANDAFRLEYQPQYDAHGRCIGTEALLRWMHPTRGDIPPADFIPLAEQTGLIRPIGRWVIEEACRQLALWSVHRDLAGLTMSINVSARQFRQRQFAREVCDILDQTRAPAHHLQFEITETVLLEDFADVRHTMSILQARGVAFSLDDFGTGYSSLAYLQRLPINQLKIDRSFVQGVPGDASDSAIARTVITLAHSLGLKVVAEGVENAEQHAFLLEHGCDAFQGFLLCRPGPPDTISMDPPH